MTEDGLLFGGNSSAALKNYIDKIEELERERSDLAEDVKDLYKEAGSDGFDTKIMRQVIRRRKMEAEDREELDELIKVYEDALAEKIEELLS